MKLRNVCLGASVIVACVILPLNALSPQSATLPSSPPSDLTLGGPLATSIIAGNQAWFLRTDVPRTSAGAGLPRLRGQHVSRPVGRCAVLTTSQACATIWVVDPTVEVSQTWPGVGLTATVRVNRHRSWGDQTTYPVTDGGGLIQLPITKNSTYDYALSRVPTGYSILDVLQWKNRSVTTWDVWMLIELVKTQAIPSFGVLQPGPAAGRSGSGSR